MKEALKITLPSALDADVNFLKLGELRIKITTRVENEVVRINFITDKPTDLFISGGTGAHFCNQEGTTNLGTIATATLGGNAFYFKPNGVFNLSFSNKFALTNFGDSMLFSHPTSIYDASLAMYAEVDLKDLKYIDSLTKVYLTDVFTGDISDRSANITHFFANRTANSPAKITGTLSPSTFNFSTLTTLSLNNQDVKGSVDGINFPVCTRIGLSNCDVSGTLLKSNIGTSLVNLDLTNTDVVMDFAALENATNIISLNLNNSLAFGDVSKLSNFSGSNLGNLKSLNLTGDIAQLNNNCYFISNNAVTGKNNNSHLSSTFYTNAKPDRAYILATESVRMTSGVDQFLIDMSSLSLHPNAVSSGSTWLKTISIRGERTSASDAAVSTLIGKGITVILN